MKTKLLVTRSVRAISTLTGLLLLLGACSEDDGGTGASAGSGGTAGTGGAAGAAGTAGSAGTGGAAGNAGEAGAAGVAGSSGAAGTAGIAGSAGSAGSAGAPPACAANDVPGFTPSWIPPAALHQSLCTEAEITTVIDGCLGANATTADCQAAYDANSTCFSCIFTPESASEYGALIDYSTTLGYLDRNMFGCYAHAEGDLSDAGCGAKIKAMFDCAIESCEGCVPATSQADIVQLNDCVTDAWAGPCKSYADESNACAATLSGPIADQCGWGNESFQTMATRYATLFCGDEG